MKFNALVGAFGDAESVFNTTSVEYLREVGIGDKAVHTILHNHDLTIAENLLARLTKLSVKVYTQNDDEYPEPLKHTPYPPSILYVLGEMPNNTLTKISVIGTRSCSQYGVKITSDICKGLAQSGVVIVSGMARGIDSVAHDAAISEGGLTIAVMGCGIDICYPKGAERLRERIISHGCVISEYPPGVFPQRGLFPERNRIIAGLSHATLVTEAALNSGTMITVASALDCGRDVMAVPGNITSPLSAGANELIKQGAQLVTSYEDILHTLKLTGRRSILSASTSSDQVIDLAPEEKLVYDMLDFVPIHLDEIIEKTLSDAQTVHYIMTMLELKGVAQRMSGQRYVKI
jgi:DNA processing protein